MTRLPVGEPDHTSIQEPDGSLEALAAAGPAAAAEVAAAHPACLAAWATLGELALGDGRPVEAYASAARSPGPRKATAASCAPSPASPRPQPPSANRTRPTAAARSCPPWPPTAPATHSRSRW